eukprot:11996694-Alexandrium_andersonii.AAC.1
MPAPSAPHAPSTHPLGPGRASLGAIQGTWGETSCWGPRGEPIKQLNPQASPYDLEDPITNL